MANAGENKVSYISQFLLYVRILPNSLFTIK